MIWGEKAENCFFLRIKKNGENWKITGPIHILISVLCFRFTVFCMNCYAVHYSTVSNVTPCILLNKFHMSQLIDSRLKCKETETISRNYHWIRNCENKLDEEWICRKAVHTFRVSQPHFLRASIDVNSIAHTKMAQVVGWMVRVFKGEKKKKKFAYHSMEIIIQT